MKMKFPVTVMVLWVVSNKGDIMPRHIFEPSLIMNTDMYNDVLTNVVKPWMDGVAAGRPYICSRTGCPPTRPRRFRTGAGRTSRSSGRRRFGFPAHRIVIHWTILCGAWLKKTPTGPPTTARIILIASIKEVFSNFTREDLKKASSRFKAKLEEVVAVKGDFIR
jgi:hypothetical protein